MNTKKYFIAFAIYWGGFGLVTAFYPALMDLFLSDDGIKLVQIFQTMYGCMEELTYLLW